MKTEMIARAVPSSLRLYGSTIFPAYGMTMTIHALFRYARHPGLDAAAVPPGCTEPRDQSSARSHARRFTRHEA